MYVKSEAICMANRLSSKGRPLELWHVPGAALNGLSTLKYTCIGTRAYAYAYAGTVSGCSKDIELCTCYIYICVCVFVLRRL